MREQALTSAWNETVLEKKKHVILVGYKRVEPASKRNKSLHKDRLQSKCHVHESKARRRAPSVGCIPSTALLGPSTQKVRNECRKRRAAFTRRRGLSLLLGSIDALGQERRSLGDPADVVKVGGSNDKSSRADEIASVADDLELLLRQTLNAAARLEVVGVAKGDNAGNLVADAGGDVLHRPVGQGSALTSVVVSHLIFKCTQKDLPVSAADNDGVGALRSSKVEHVPHLADSDKGTAEEVRRQAGGIVHSLDSNVELRPELVGKRRPNCLALSPSQR